MWQGGSVEGVWSEPERGHQTLSPPWKRDFKGTVKEKWKGVLAETWKSHEFNDTYETSICCSCFEKLIKKKLLKPKVIFSVLMLSTTTVHKISNFVFYQMRNRNVFENLNNFLNNPNLYLIGLNPWLVFLVLQFSPGSLNI